MKSQTKPVRLASALLLTLACLAGASVLFIGCDRSRSTAATGGTTKAKTLYTCGMHPEVIQDKPGNCPICGMKLTPIRKQAAESSPQESAATAESGLISIDPVTTQKWTSAPPP